MSQEGKGCLEECSPAFFNHRYIVKKVISSFTTYGLLEVGAALTFQRVEVWVKSSD